MYQATENPNLIFDTETAGFIPRGCYLWPADESLISPYAAPVLTFDDFVAHVSLMAGSWLDMWVHEQFNYDGIVSCISYLDDANPTYAAQAAAAKAWRSAVYTRLYESAPTYATMDPGKWPDDATIIAGLPQPSGYTWSAPPPPA